MKIYTRTGDSGSTGLFGGDRVDKTHPLLEAYGTVDELNSFVGLARAHLSGVGALAMVDDVLGRIQGELLVLGADLATPPDARPFVPRVNAGMVAVVEEDIDAFDNVLPALKQFIKPTGTPAAATLHVCRTVCRRAERRTLAAASGATINRTAAIYLNRLSDLLFVLARTVVHRSGTPEEPWVPDKP